MHAIVIGYTHRSGVAKESKKPYDMKMLLILHPVEPGQGENWKLDGHGYQTAELDVADTADTKPLEGQKFPLIADLEIGSVLRRGKLASVVEGFKSVKPFATA